MYIHTFERIGKSMWLHLKSECEKAWTNTGQMVKPSVEKWSGGPGVNIMSRKKGQELASRPARPAVSSGHVSTPVAVG